MVRRRLWTLADRGLVARGFVARGLMTGVMLCSVTSCGGGPPGAQLRTMTLDTVGLPAIASIASIAEAVPPALVEVASEPPWQSTPQSKPESIPVTADAAPARRHARFAFTGDTLVHSPLVRQAAQNASGVGYDFAPMFDSVSPLLSEADEAVCHLESPVAPAGQPLTTYPVYGVPAEIAAALGGAGYDRCSTASNHSLDRGTAGIDATVNALEAAGLGQSGMARTPQEATVGLFDVAGISVAHLSYTFGFNGAHVPAGEPWRTNKIDSDRIVGAAQDARLRGAEVVILSLHWGDEGRSNISPYQYEVASEVTRSGAVDLIVGHHAHVIQPIEFVNDRWVVFGMGNFLSNMPTGDSWPASTQDGMIVTVSIDEQPDGMFTVGRPAVIPTWVDRGAGFVIRPVLAGLADPSLDEATRRALYASLERTGAVVGDYVATAAGG